MKTSICLLLFLLYFTNVFARYALPEIDIRPLQGKGLKVSMPVVDGENVLLFAFHGNVNKQIRGKEQGDISRSATRPHNGRWELIDEDVALKQGDKINYWVFVQNDRLGFDQEDREFEVKELFPPEIATCSETETRIKNANKAPCGGYLLFEDDFQNNKMKNDVWDVLQYIPSEKEGEFVYYKKDDPENLYVRNEVLHIKPIGYDINDLPELPLDLRNGCTVKNSNEACYIVNKVENPWLIHPPIRSAKIRSKTAFRYGRVEIRAKLPAGDWLVPRLVLEPEDYDVNKRPSEIFIAYARGNADLKKGADDLGNKQLFSGVSVDPNLRTKHMIKLQQVKNWSNNFHTYQIEWTSAGLAVFIDARKVVQETQLPSVASDFKNKFFRVSIALSAGGVPDFPEDGETLINNGNRKPWSNTAPQKAGNFIEAAPQWKDTWRENDSELQIEYVRVYAI